MDIRSALKLYLITDRRFLKGRSLNEAVEAAILGGVTIVQVREKDISSRQFFEITRSVKQVTDYYNIPLIINDRLDIAQAVGAAGVHLGQSDLHLLDARRILGQGKIIGISAGNTAEAAEAEKNGADYLGIGAVYPTDSKSDADEPIGLGGLRNVVSSITIPSVAIGGINRGNVGDIFGAGVNGVSVISAILDNEDIRKAAEHLNI
ncbi:MAG TPA: thiamine phosphate synthase [Clostridiaceae bacterium]